MKEDALRAAVEHSGYPLQTVVARQLDDRGFWIDEEWGWLDPEQRVERTLDVVGERRAGESHVSERGEVGVFGSLLIECKQSRNPYLGFATVAPPTLEAHPRIAGLNGTQISIHGDEGNRSRRVPLISLFGLSSHPYLTEPLMISSLSHGRPNGKRVELSGQETFNAVVRPLTKAASRFREHWRALEGQSADHAARLVFPIAVVDGPLLAVRGRRGASEISAADWLRVISRHVVDGENRARRRIGFDVIDIVAADHLESFLDERLWPFVEEFRGTLTRVQDIVLAGRATLPGFEVGAELPWNALELLRA